MIEVICIGKIKEEYLKNLISDYEKRISKYLKIIIKELILLLIAFTKTEEKF